ncbi:hypothetical protein Tel_04995 [Candidatus Tenderia electrophaga]|uniref:Uncharacterized protein n=1 Tax=Candidatus Tenderia electrophaga TaxID=1748243 RepID=A0A0S2TBP0_9GAMM|nr:hypothetical protein Tel_04995 [Candidatus Tenderia electrophaga]
MKSWHLITWGIVLWSSLLLAGCSGLPLWLETPEAKRNPAASVAPLTAEQAVLQQFAWVQRAAAEQLERELPALEEVFALQPVERHRLRLAVTLGFADCRGCDRQRAVELFQQSQREAEEDTTRTLAAMFLDLLETRTQLEARGTELARQRQAAQALQQQLGALQEKLDALTSIEESLHQRE